MVEKKNFTLTILLFLLCTISITHAADLRLYNGTINNFQIYSLESPQAFMHSSYFQLNRRTIFYTHGTGGGPTSDDVKAVVPAWLVQNVNTVLLNWEEGARFGSIGDMRSVGEQFGQCVILMKSFGLQLTFVKLVGNGLGAQLMSVAGRRIKEAGEPVAWITGLDPASLVSDIYVRYPILASDGRVVEVLHTDYEDLGSIEADATVDIWANCNRAEQPGCRNIEMIETFFDENCSHNRAYMYFAEAISNPRAFHVRIADNCIEWRSGFGGSQTFFWGENYDTTNLHGNFYFITNRTSPYGLGEEGSRP